MAAPPEPVTEILPATTAAAEAAPAQPVPATTPLDRIEQAFETVERETVEVVAVDVSDAPAVDGSPVDDVPLDDGPVGDAALDDAAVEKPVGVIVADEPADDLLLLEEALDESVELSESAAPSETAAPADSGAHLESGAADSAGPTDRGERDEALDTVIISVDESTDESAHDSVRGDESTSEAVLSLTGLVKRFGTTVAVDGVDLEVQRGGFYGIVGPNGAGKTTTLSMITGLVRPDEGIVRVNGHDVWKDPADAKRVIGILPDKLRLFDRLTGRQLLHYSGSLRGLNGQTVRERADELAEAFGIQDALNRLVSDYSAGMTKKVALAASMIHSPRLLVLDEPFESVDPVSADTVTDILQKYVASGGTVVLSSHSMEMIERVCDGVAIIVHGRVLTSGTVDHVRNGSTLEDRFIELAGGHKAVEGMEWLLSSLD